MRQTAIMRIVCGFRLCADDAQQLRVIDAVKVRLDNTVEDVQAEISSRRTSVAVWIFARHTVDLTPHTAYAHAAGKPCSAGYHKKGHCRKRMQDQICATGAHGECGSDLRSFYLAMLRQAATLTKLHRVLEVLYEQGRFDV